MFFQAINSGFTTHQPAGHIPVHTTGTGVPLAGEPIVVKTVNSAFIGTDLEARLHREGSSTLVICGITTDHCVSTTTRRAAKLGFDATVVSDATAAFERLGPDGLHWSAAEMHDAALASLHVEFATIQTTNEVVFAVDW